MEELKLDIVRRKKLDRSAFIYGMMAAVLVVGGLYQYISLGKVPFIEELTRQLGVLPSLKIITLVFFIFFGLILLRGLITLFRKKREVGGSITLNQEHLNIKKGKQSFYLSGQDLQELQFEIQPPADQRAPLSGGNWVKIPSPKGTYRCEFDMCDAQTFKALKTYIHHFESVHQVHINLKESKNF